jgi:hypothetical protein
MAKPRLLIGWLLALALICVGCSGDSVVISESSTAQSFSLSCERLSDTWEIPIPVGESASVTLSASVSRKHGSVSILIADTVGDVIYSGSDIASATSFNLMLEGPAEYTVQLTTNDFTGTLDLKWETVGVSTADLPAASGAENAGDAAQPSASSDSDVVITNNPTESDDPVTEVPDWNGTFYNADNGVTIELFWGDNNSVEFQISGNGSVVTATARIDGDDPSYAEYEYDEMSLVLHLTDSGLIVTQTGECSLVPTSIAGEYLLTASDEP